VHSGTNNDKIATLCSQLQHSKSRNMMKSMHAILLSTLVLALVNVAYGKLVFTEIMLQPKGALNNATQWFEVYNTENAVVALNGYEFRHCSVDCQDFTNSFPGFVQPFGYVVFGNNNDIATNGGVVALELQFKELPKDGSGNNVLAIRPPNAMVYDDTLRWSSDSGASSQYAKLPFAAGASVAKVNALATGQDVANWKTSTAFLDCVKGGDKGTPGKLNSYLCPTKTPTKAPTNAPANPTKVPTRTPTKKPTPVPTRTPTKKPTKAPTRAPTKSPSKAPLKGPTNAPAKAAPTNDVPSKAPIVSAPAAPVKSPTGTKPNTGRKRCGLLGLSIVCFNGCGMFGRLLNICQQ
jgi:hypothetical protein